MPTSPASAEPARQTLPGQVRRQQGVLFAEVGQRGLGSQVAAADGSFHGGRPTAGRPIAGQQQIGNLRGCRGAGGFRLRSWSEDGRSFGDQLRSQQFGLGGLGPERPQFVGNLRGDGIAIAPGQLAAHEQKARVVAIAGNSIESPRLLLNSRSATFPAGLANRSGLVGKRLMLHPLARVTGRFEEWVGGHRGITAGGIVSHEFYETDPARGFSRGVKLLVMRSHGPLLTALGSMFARPPWGRGHHERFEAVFDHTVAVSVCVDDLPEECNTVTLSADMTDRTGRPAAAMTYRIGENSRKALDFGLASFD